MSRSHSVSLCLTRSLPHCVSHSQYLTGEPPSLTVLLCLACSRSHCVSLAHYLIVSSLLTISLCHGLSLPHCRTVSRLSAANYMTIDTSTSKASQMQKQLGAPFRGTVRSVNWNILFFLVSCANLNVRLPSMVTAIVTWHSPRLVVHQIMVAPLGLGLGLGWG